MTRLLPCLALCLVGCAHREVRPTGFVTTEICMSYHWSPSAHRWACDKRGLAELPQSLMGPPPVKP